jgi:hypothetical protein
MRVSPPRIVRASAENMVADRVQRLLGFALLDESEQRVEHDNRKK